MFKVEPNYYLNIIKITIEAGVHSEEESKIMSDAIIKDMNVLIGDFSYWTVIVPSNRPCVANQCKFVSNDIIVRKVLGLKKVVIQIDPNDQASIHSAADIERAFKKNIADVKIVHSESEALQEFESHKSAS